MRRPSYLILCWFCGLFLAWLGVWVAFTEGTVSGLAAGLFIVTLVLIMIPSFAQVLQSLTEGEKE